MRNFKAVIIDFGIAKSFESVLVCDEYRQATWIFLSFVLHIHVTVEQWKDGHGNIQKKKWQECCSDKWKLTL